ncbi:hypothetical protein [Occallatibacter riparius]|uniref:DUF2489 domain-containing protein n=1 Tax=Occallatibacter riparius TaxID=1002689 RepID=A0A9J7BV41_9BACT|nr:hypothetical protein [Occallatibacter riparius]UWZ84885.1 hypothetical protein MOP44_02850 [Occallatibacter riparius]
MEITDTQLAKVRQIAQTVVEGDMGAVEAAYLLLPILRRFSGLVTQDDLNFVIAIGSETDDLPLGPVRELWDPNVLIEKDREIARCDELWKDQFRATCERIQSRLLPS